MFNEMKTNVWMKDGKKKQDQTPISSRVDGSIIYKFKRG